MSLQEDLAEWNQLINHPKWKQLCEWATEQTNYRTVALIEGRDSQREEDKLRGEVLGINLFIQYPPTIIEGLRVELDNLQQED